MTDFRPFRETGELSDLKVVVDGEEFHLHKFPLYVKSDFFKALARCSMADQNRVELTDFPGGKKIFALVADYCYTVPIDINSSNVAQLRCAAEFLQMTSGGNLASEADAVLFDVVRSPRRSIEGIMEVFLTCCELGAIAEQANIVSWCVSALVELWRSRKLSDEVLGKFSKVPLPWFVQMVVTARDGCVAGKSLAKAAFEFMNGAFISHKREIETFLKKHYEESKTVKLEDLECPHHDQEEGKGSGKDVSDLQEIKDIMDLIFMELPESASFKEVASTQWMCLALRLATSLQCKCRDTLLNLAADVLPFFTTEELVSLPPKMLVEITEYCCGKDSLDSKTLVTTIDNYLLQLVKQNKLNSETFKAMATVVPGDFRENHDSLLFVVEQLLINMGDEKCKQTQNNLLEVVDHRRLSENALQQISESEVIPLQYITKAALALCSSLRGELENAKSTIISKEEQLSKMWQCAIDCEGTYVDDRGNGHNDFVHVHPQRLNNLNLQLTHVVPHSSTQVEILDHKLLQSRLAVCGYLQKGPTTHSLFVFNPFKPQVIEVQSLIDTRANEEQLTVESCLEKVEQNGSYWPLSPTIPGSATSE